MLLALFGSPFHLPFLPEKSLGSSLNDLIMGVQLEAGCGEGAVVGPGTKAATLRAGEGCARVAVLNLALLAHKGSRGRYNHSKLCGGNGQQLGEQRVASK